MPFVDLATGARLHYEESGSPGAPPLIALHGMLGTARLHVGRVIDWLSADYHVYGPTLRGYGESTPKPRDFPLNFYHRDADDVLAFIDALNIPQTHLLGYSDGGETALVAAGKQPQRFRSVAVWGAVGCFGPAMRPSVQRMYPADWLKPEAMALHGLTDANAFALGWVNATKHMIDSGGDVSLSLADKIACPVLLMLGDQDKLNPEEYAREFVQRAPQGQLRMFACRHAVHDERWAEFQRTLGEFLRTAG
jgi:valacyclovir hydrolase